MRACFNSSITRFIDITEDAWLKDMLNNFRLIFNGEVPSGEQILAWKDCFFKLQRELKKASNINGQIIFEYLLPMEGGRRPDVILLVEDKVIILEFKMKSSYARSDFDQLKGYYRDITSYHRESFELEVIPFLITTMCNNKYKLVDEKYHICSTDMFIEALKPLLEELDLKIDVDKWVESEYAPLPTLVSAAIDIFNNTDVKELRSAKSAGIYIALDKLKNISDWSGSEKNKKKVNSISFVTGVPGAGKTLLGLEFVHQSNGGTFLSGNGPLVQVLQYALKNKTFVTDLFKFKGEYTNNLEQPHTNIIVFDEAQRAWDAKKNKKYGKSEPQCIIEIADKTTEPCHYIGLIGEGQEIYTGEERGITLWKEALENSKELWYITCPEAIEGYFKGIEGVKVTVIEEFNLDFSLRSHLANKYPEWVAGILENSSMIELANETIGNGFSMYITRDLDKAKRYCKARYKKSIYKKYGLIASSNANTLNKYIGAKKFKYSEKEKLGPWFHDDTTSSESCCSFRYIASEFDCQGLEIDMPIVCWGEDLLYRNGDWVRYNSDKKLEDPHRIRINSYRVLLTRGRDGVIVYMPQEDRFNESYEFLVTAGMQKL
jgi:hypothetical protein